jgi:hypothetical protein
MVSAGVPSGKPLGGRGLQLQALAQVPDRVFYFILSACYSYVSHACCHALHMALRAAALGALSHVCLQLNPWFCQPQVAKYSEGTTCCL